MGYDIKGYDSSTDLVSDGSLRHLIGRTEFSDGGNQVWRRHFPSSREPTFDGGEAYVQ